MFRLRIRALLITSLSKNGVATHNGGQPISPAIMGV